MAKHSTSKPTPASRAKSVGFRAGSHLRQELESLSRELSTPAHPVTISDILRDGCTAYWPHIHAYMRARVRHRSITPRILAQLITAAVKAHRLGLKPADVERALNTALAARQLGSIPPHGLRGRRRAAVSPAS